MKMVIVYSDTLWLLYKEGDEYVAYAPAWGKEFREKEFRWISALPFASDRCQPELWVEELIFVGGHDVVVAVRVGENEYKYFAGPDIAHLREVS